MSTTKAPAYKRGLLSQFTLWLGTQPMDQPSAAAGVAAALGWERAQGASALHSAAAAGYVDRVARGLFVRHGGKLREPAPVIPAVLGPDSDEMLDAMLELLVGQRGIKPGQFRAVEAWRQATRSLILALTEE